MLRKLLLAIVLTLSLSSFAYGQSTTVSGTIIDANGQAFASGTYKIEFNPGSVPPPYQWNGAPFVPGNNVFSGSLNSSGAFSGVSVPSNTSIAPNTQWKFTFCPASSSPCYSNSIGVTGATLNVTSQMNPPAIVVYSGNYPPAAYSDSEIAQPVLGFTYFNLTDQKNHTCTVAVPCTWVAGGGGGAPSGAAGGALSGTYPNPTAPQLGPNLQHYYIDSTCASGITNCLALVDDNSTDNCGTALTTFMSTINGYAGPGIPDVSIQDGGANNASSAFKFTSCDLKFTSSVNLHINATINCNQASGDCIQIGTTGQSANCTPGVAGATIHGPCVWTAIDGTGTFINGASLTTGGILIPPYQSYVSIQGALQFINFGPTNATIGNCTAYAVSADVLNNGIIHGLRWWSWDNNTGRCAITVTDSSSTGGLSTVIIDGVFLSGFGGSTCSSQGIVLGGAHNVITGGTSVAGFGVPIRIQSDHAADAGNIISGTILDVNGCSAKGAKADIWLGGNGSSQEVQNLVISNTDVHGATINSLATKAPDSTAPIDNVKISDNDSDNGAAPIVLSTDSCISQCFQDNNANLIVSDATNWYAPAPAIVPTLGIVGTDNFHRNNLVNLGPNWLVQGGVVTAMQVNNQTAYPNAAAGAFAHWVQNGIFTPNQYCEVTIVGTAATPANYVGCSVEATAGTASTAYNLQVGGNDPGGPYIQKQLAGVSSILLSCVAHSNAGYKGSNGDVLRMEAVVNAAGTSTTLRILKNGVPLTTCGTPTVFTVTDSSSPMTSGYPGIWMFGTAVGTDWGISKINVGNLPTFTTYGLSQNVTTQTTTYTALATDDLILCNGTFTVTLPVTNIVTGKVYHIKNNGSGTCTVSAGGSINIDGATTFTLSPLYAEADVAWDGTQYWIESVRSNTASSPLKDPQSITNFNQAAQSLTVSSGTPFYVTNSDLDMPATYTQAIAAGTTFRWRVGLTKSAAGTGTFQVILYQGTNGSTADTANTTVTIGTQTAAADNAEMDVTITFTSATAYYYSILFHQAAASATGFGLVYPAAAAQFTGTKTGLTTTTASLKFGLGFTFTTGTPTVTVNQVQAQAFGVN